jgi:hypothetical protein
MVYASAAQLYCNWLMQWKRLIHTRALPMDPDSNQLSMLQMWNCNCNILNTIELHCSNFQFFRQRQCYHRAPCPDLHSRPLFHCVKDQIKWLKYEKYIGCMCVWRCTHWYITCLGWWCLSGSTCILHHFRTIPTTVPYTFTIKLQLVYTDMHKTDHFFQKCFLMHKNITDAVWWWWQHVFMIHLPLECLFPISRKFKITFWFLAWTSTVAWQHELTK